MQPRHMRRMARWLIEGGIAAAVTLALTGVLAGTRPHAVEAQSARTFSGSFGGSGTFSNSTCTWRTTYSGTVTLTLTFGASGVTGTARHRGSYQDVLTNGPAECGGDFNAFDEAVAVSGTAQALTWGFGHGNAGRVAVTGSLIGNAIVGRGVTTDPEYSGSAVIPFTAPEVGAPSPPAPAPTSTPTAAPTSVPTTVPTAVRTAAPTASAAAPAAPSAGANAAPSGTPNANAPVGVAPALPTVPTVPPPKDAGSTATVKRELCQAISGDAGVWQMIEDHVGEWTSDEMPSSVLAACVAQYRAQPWTGDGQLDTLKDDKGTQQGNGQPPADNPPVKATLETLTPLFLRPGEKVPATVPAGGAPLGKGDAIITKGEPATVRFSDGSRIDLGPKTALIAADPEKKSLIQMRGRMFMDIKSRNWVIRVPDPRGMVSVSVRGTQFSTEVIEGGSVKVEVNEGTVEVTSAGKTVAVSAGSAIIVQPGQAPPTPKSAGGTPLALYGGIAAAVLALIAAGVFLMRRRGRA
ncbi:MAG: hypothetical protein EPO65_07810 [Dehalococcoidia bacterium]|nr:MAG: hypothetical protein EPO65_07810 [Dehalococcoidia bacterium]